MESDNMSEGQTPPQNLTDEEDQKDETDSIPEAEVIEPGHGYEGGEQLRTQILRRTKTGIQDSTQTNRDTGTDTLLMTNISIEEFLEVLDCSFDNNEEEYWEVEEYYDTCLEQEVNIYDQCILLTQGIYLPSLVNQLSFGQDSTDSDQLVIGTKEAQEFIHSIIALLDWDYENLMLHSEALASQLGFGKSIKSQQASINIVKAMMITKGESFKNGSLELLEISEQYDKIFKKLFGTQSSRAKSLHNLAAMNQREMIQLLYGYFSVKDQPVLKMIKSQNQEWLDELFTDSWALNEKSASLMFNLALLTLGETYGLNDILSAYGLSSTTKRIVKGLWTKDSEQMEPLFRELRLTIPFKKCWQLAKILEGKWTTLIIS